MRHRVYGKHLQRDKNQRTALFRSLVRGLILHQSIQTTDTKAKAIRGLIDRLVTKSKQKTSASARVLQSFINQPDILKRFNEEIVPTLGDRTSGYTQTVRMGTRLGDGAMIVKMSFIQSENKAQKVTDTKKVKVAKKSNKKESK